MSIPPDTFATPARPSLPALAPKPPKPGLGRRVAIFAAVVVIFWVVVAVAIGTGRTSVVSPDEAPFNLDALHMATASQSPRDLLPAVQGTDTQRVTADTADRAAATYASDRATVDIAVQRYPTDAAARAAVLPLGQMVPDPKQHRERVTGTDRFYYQYDGGNPGKSGIIYTSGPFVVSITATRTSARDVYAAVMPF